MGLKCNPKSQLGQAITEYPLIMGLIAVVCIGLLITLGGNLSNMMNLIASGGGPGLGSVAQAALGAGADGGGGGSVPAAQSGGAPQAPPSPSPWQSGGNDQVVQEPPAPLPATSTGTTIEINGKVYQLPTPTDPNAIITASSNGNEITQAYIQQLYEMADKIEALTPDDPSLADRIRQVADKGYDLAIYQTKIETICQQSVCTQETSMDQILTDGLAKYNDFHILESMLQAEIGGAGFLSAENKAALAALIGYNAQAISTISDQYISASILPTTDPDTGENIYKWNGFDKEVAGSDLTEVHSGTICDTQSQYNCG